jgi:hypothetical protein
MHGRSSCVARQQSLTFSLKSVLMGISHAQHFSQLAQER